MDEDLVVVIVALGTGAVVILCCGLIICAFHRHQKKKRDEVEKNKTAAIPVAAENLDSQQNESCAVPVVMTSPLNPNNPLKGWAKVRSWKVQNGRGNKQEPYVSAVPSDSVFEKGDAASRSARGKAVQGPTPEEAQALAKRRKQLGKELSVWKAQYAEVHGEEPTGKDIKADPSVAGLYDEYRSIPKDILTQVCSGTSSPPQSPKNSPKTSSFKSPRIHPLKLTDTSWDPDSLGKLSPTNLAKSQVTSFSGYIDDASRCPASGWRCPSPVMEVESVGSNTSEPSSPTTM